MTKVPNLPQFDGCYKVLVFVPTYNHEKYIEDTLIGILQQKVDFPYVALVLDDCSTDSTAEIVKRYECQYPNEIKGWYMSENQFSQESSLTPFLLPLINVFQYVAFCEGDDYWTDPLKLQKQVDFMESHKDCSMCFHNAVEHWEDGRYEDRRFSNVEDREYSAYEIMNTWVIPSASTFYRTRFFSKEDFYRLINNRNFMFYDDVIFLYFALQGKIYGISDEMCVYRRLNSGYTLNLISNLDRSLEMVKKYIVHNQAMRTAFGQTFGTEFRNLMTKIIIQNSLSGLWLATKKRSLDSVDFFLKQCKGAPIKIYVKILCSLVLNTIKRIVPSPIKNKIRTVCNKK